MLAGLRRRLSELWGKPEKFDAQYKAETGPDLYSKVIPAKLMDRVRKAYRDMEGYREDYRRAVRQFLGRYMAGNNTVEKEVIVPLLRYMVKIYVRLLASGTPQAQISTEFAHLQAFAADFEATFNRHLKEIEIGPAMEDATWNAMFGVGVLKTGLAEGDEDDRFEVDGELYDIGAPFTASVPLGNFVVDLQPTSRYSIDFIGDRFLRPRAWVAQMREGAEGDAAGSLQNSQMLPQARVSGLDDDANKRLYDMVWVWEIYLPKQNLMVTYADGSDNPLRVEEWDGPEGGPYQMLGFDWVSGEVLPSPPAGAMAPLHRMTNAIMRKIDRQAANAKSVTLYDRANPEDGEVLKNANDLDVVGVSNLEERVQRQLQMNRPDASIHQIALWAIQEFDKYGGSLGVLSGASPMSETVGQDQLLHQSANALVNEMRKELRRAMKKVLYQHAWYVWTDPIRTYQGQRFVPGTGIAIPVSMSPEVREGDFLQYNIDLREHSLTERTPVEQAQALREFWQTDILPNMPLFQATGQIPDARAYSEQLIELLDLPLSDLFVEADPTSAAGGSGGEGMIPWPEQFRHSETVNTRVSKPGTTRGAQDNEMMRAVTAMAQNQGQQ